MHRVLAGMAFLFLAISSATAQNCGPYPNTLANGQNADANQVMANFNYALSCINSQIAPRSYLSGLTLSTAGSSATFGIAAGVATSDDTTTQMKLSTSYAKTTATWSVGSGNGSLDTGSIANNTWYHIFAIARTDTGVVDVLVSQSATTPTLPTNYTKQRRIGSMKTNGSGQWTKFYQRGDEFTWDVPISNANNVNPGTTPTLYTMTVPSGVVVNAKTHVAYSNTTSTNAVLIYSPVGVAQAAGVPSGNVTIQNQVTGLYGASEVSVETNTSAQIYAVCNTANNNSLYLVTFGWTDRRGRDQ